MLTASATQTQPRPPGRLSSPVIVSCSTLFVVVATVTQLFRQSGVEMWRTVWAEDGAVFYVDALERPFREIALESYAGYAHFLSRLLASIGVHLPTEWFSGFVVVSSALLASLLALFVYFASAPLLRSPIRQGVLAVALVLWPVLPYEISGAICNLHWVMPTACLLAVLVPVDRWGAVAVRLLIVVLAPLSSPLCVFFAPIAVWQVVVAARARSRPLRFVVPLAYLAAVAGQLLVWLTASRTPSESAPLGELAVDVAKLYSTKVSTEFLFGVRVTEDLWDRLGYVLAAVSLVALATALVWRFLRSSTAARWFIAACVVGSGGLYAFSIWQRPTFIEGMLVDADGAYNFIGMRYQLFPAALLLLALLVRRDLSLDVFTAPARRSPVRLRADLRQQRAVVAVVAVWMLVAFVPSFRLTTYRSVGPDWVANIDAADQACALDPEATVPVPISPAPTWTVPIACSDFVP